MPKEKRRRRFSELPLNVTVTFSDNCIRIIEIEVGSQMTYTRTAVALLSAGIFLAGVLAGCKTPPPSPRPPIRAPIKKSAPPPPPPLPPPPDLPARPLTRDILDLIEKSSYETRELQYFISSTVTLERGKGMQIDIELSPSGQGVIQEINAHERIIIPKDIGGVLIPNPGPAIPGGPRTIQICFEDEDEHTLTFRENPSDRRYYLVFREDRQYGEFTEYGSESYRVTFDKDVPYLYVRLDERIDDTPRSRQLQGRYVSSDYSAKTPRARRSETAPTSVQETVVPGRSPQPREPAPAAAPPPAEAEEDELDLEALLER
jgi:hypothetical protein